MRGKIVLFTIVAFACSLLHSSIATANGRFPDAQQLAFAPKGGDAKLVVLRTTFGILVSRDAGKSWHWICEKALGFTGEWDPPIAVTKDGRIWVGLVDGLRATRDGCESTEVLALKAARVTDLAVDASGENLLVTSSPVDGPGRVLVVHTAKGDAVETIGSTPPKMHLSTADFAPSSGKIYVSGKPFQSSEKRRGHLYAAARGKPLVEIPTSLPDEDGIYLSAIDPKNDAHLVIRTLAPGGSDVAISDDGGKTFTSTFHSPTLLYGFAKSEDAKTLFVGSGDPQDGVSVSKDGGKTWKKASGTSVRCLGLANGLLYACSTPYRPNGFAVASSSDLGATFTTLTTFADIVGPVACDAGEGTACVSLWPAQKQALTIQKPLGVSEDAGRALPSGADAGDVRSVKVTAKSSCGCSEVGARAGSGGGFALLFILGLLLVRMDRRRSIFEPSMDHAQVEVGVGRDPSRSGDP